MKRLLIAAILMMAGSAIAQQATVGKQLANVRILNSSDKPTALPGFGEKVLVILYTDPDVKDINDQLSDAIKAKNFPADKYLGVGIANCKVTWIPNAAIRMKARQKEAQFAGSTVLIDDSEKLKSAWGLADGDSKGIVLIVGKDGKLKHISYVKSKEESVALIATVTKVLKEEIGK